MDRARIAAASIASISGGSGFMHITESLAVAGSLNRTSRNVHPLEETSSPGVIRRCCRVAGTGLSEQGGASHQKLIIRAGGFAAFRYCPDYQRLAAPGV